MAYGSYKNAAGENEVRMNDPSDHGSSALPVADRVVVPPPTGMTQQDWDDAVVMAAEDLMSKPSEPYILFPPADATKGGNCHSTTARILTNAGGSVPQDFNPRGANPGLHPVPPSPAPRLPGLPGYGSLRYR